MELGFPSGSAVKNPPAMQESRETLVQSLGQKDPLDKGMATHSSILAWRIPTDRGARRATVHRVAKSQTRLKRLSMNTHKRGAELGLTGMQFVSEFSQFSTACLSERYLMD